MTKQQSQMLKGVAIIMMVWSHLMVHTDSYSPLLTIAGKPLALWLVGACAPVAFFLFLSGYGLYEVNNHREDRNRWGRLAKLYIHYWLILAFMLLIGQVLLHKDIVKGPLVLVENMTGYDTTYCPEMWFLLPFVIFSATAKWLFKFLARINAIAVVAVTLCLHLATSYAISRYGVEYIYTHRWLYIVLLQIHFLFSFCFGAMAARQKWFAKIRNWVEAHRIVKPSVLKLGGVMGLVSISCVFKYNFLYVFLLSGCLLLTPMPRWLGWLLQKLGNQSMNMWMIHTWLGIYLFKDAFFSLQNPLLIFAAVMGASYLCGLAVDAIARPIERTFLTRRQIDQKPMI